MRKHLAVTFAGLLILAAGSGCKRKKITPPLEPSSQEGTVLSSTVRIADPATAYQLLRGFHALEQNAWRWSMQRFSVALRPPAGSTTAGATLVLRFSVPDPVIQKLGKITLASSIAGVKLPGETYSKTGDAIYSQPVPTSVLNGETATFDFALDRALPAGAVDSRELGVIVTEISLESK